MFTLSRLAAKLFKVIVTFSWGEGLDGDTSTDMALGETALTTPDNTKNIVMDTNEYDNKALPFIL
jgi:hypothetical protein